MTDSKNDDTKYIFDNLDDNYSPTRLGEFQSDLVKMLDRCRRDGAISDGRHRNLMDCLSRWEDDREAILHIGIKALAVGYKTPEDAERIYKELRATLGDDALIEDMHKDIDEFEKSKRDLYSNAIDGLDRIKDILIQHQKVL